MYVAAASTATATATTAAIQNIFILKISGKANEREGVRAVVCMCVTARDIQREFVNGWNTRLAMMHIHF